MNLNNKYALQQKSPPAGGDFGGSAVRITRFCPPL